MFPVLPGPAILLVDDDSCTRFLMHRYLERLPLCAQILEATDGAQALDLVQAHCQVSSQPLLILLDLNMPIMNGLEFLDAQQHLPESYRQLLTTVVLSGTPKPAERTQAQRLATAVACKPVSEVQLASFVQQYLPTALVA